MDPMTRTLRPFFYYYGGKHRMAPYYPPPKHRRLVEPFAGSAAYATMYPHHQVELYDVDPTIVGLWQYLIGASERDIRFLPELVANTDELPDSVCEEARWLIGFWLVARGIRKPVLGRAVTAPRADKWNARKRDMLASQVRYIRHWRATLGSYETIPSDPAATWFVDPPYNNPAGNGYTHGRNGIDYQRLAEWCRAQPGQMMVCENAGATWLPFKPFGMFRGGGTRKFEGGESRKSFTAEAIWTSDV